MEDFRNTKLMYRILAILKEKPNQPIKIVDMIKRMDELHQLDKPPARNTIKSHLESLIGMSERNELEDGKVTAKLSNSGESVIGYSFEPSVPPMKPEEIKLLCDAIASSRMIGREKSKELINKLASLGGVDLPKKYDPLVKLKSDENLYNDDLFDNVALLTEAIQLKKKVKLQYLKYTHEKELVPVHHMDDGYSTISPYHLHWALDHYYVFCKIDKSREPIPRFLRVDKIRDITILDDAAEALELGIYGLHEYTRNQAFMFGGDMQRISLLCQNQMLGQTIDFFGEAAEIKKVGETHFRLEVKTSVRSITYWVIQYITAIDEIYYPLELKEKVLEELRAALGRIT